MDTKKSESLRQDFYYWRVIATAISFTNFGIGGLVLRFICFPIVSLLPIQKRKKTLLCRKMVHNVYRLFIWQMNGLKVLSYETHNLDKLKGGQLIIANHPTLIDVCFILASVPNANCIIKEALFKNPFTRGPVSGAGFIPNIDAEQLISDCVESLNKGDSLIIFPEGTRTPPGKKPRLQRGAANIALTANKELTPITIKCSENTLKKGEKWYHIPPRRPHWTLEVGDSIALPENERSPVTARQLTNTIYEYFWG
jgi:1-acyl-sn-glycerol-3-phosphate acyltransferase